MITFESLSLFANTNQSLSQIDFKISFRFEFEIGIWVADVVVGKTIWSLLNFEPLLFQISIFCCCCCCCCLHRLFLMTRKFGCRCCCCCCCSCCCFVVVKMSFQFIVLQFQFVWRGNIQWCINIRRSFRNKANLRKLLVKITLNVLH